MERLPNELILHILEKLDVQDLLRVQASCKRLKRLAKDSFIWKAKCFWQTAHGRWLCKSPYERDQKIAEIRAMLGDMSAHLTAASGLLATTTDREFLDMRTRAALRWDPTYPSERLDFQQEYVQRNAPIAPIDWCVLSGNRTAPDASSMEAVGVGTLDNCEGGVEKLVAPLSDGSVCIWDLEPSSTNSVMKLSAQSPSGILVSSSGPTGKRPRAIGSNATDSATDGVALDSWHRHGFFAVDNAVHQVDLTTLQTISCRSYAFPISTLSKISQMQPLTVGTSQTIHLHDSRISQTPQDSPFRLELIGGPREPEAVLAQPGPLSILHQGDDIWVGGNFTHLLCYDRRFFPRLANSVFSGARISSLASLPAPPGSTLVAAGVYKGKGSLELFAAGSRRHYTNRVSAARTRLLSVAPHGGTLATADADGNLAWFERSAAERVRSVNINPVIAEGEEGDYVRKILPLGTTAGQEPLLLWTGDGRIGVLGFGRRSPLRFEKPAEADDGEAEGPEREKERAFSESMRRALEAQASEARFMRGLGLGG